MSESDKRNIRVWRVDLNSTAGIVIGPNKVMALSDKKTFLAMRPGHVTLRSNRIDLLTMPENITKGVIFRENIGFAQLMPSTIASPIPNLTINIPGVELMDYLADQGIFTIQSLMAL
ncbi:hypothetical protein CMI41_03790 [Candidatus Pacearchaeota archaeon]|jgi:hypothetical protein|nr:hypothetical protein [Candidatus Pacearchaeota archaeon]|tara:strand:- start:9729 stop:10079 length:351 start_codon:yes stop_codon:yes gene_type:complete